VDDEYLVSAPLQLKAVSNPLRMRMLEQLIDQPRTATQLGAVLDMAPSRAHYHVKQLEAAGLCRMVEQREHAGILEKYYRAVAGRFRLAGTLTTGPGEAEPVDAEVEEAVRGYVRRLQQGAGGAGQEQMVWQELTLRLSPQRYERMLARLRALLLEFDSAIRDDRPGLHEYRLLVVAYPEDPPAAPPGPPVAPD